MRGIILTATISSALLAVGVWWMPDGRDAADQLIVGSIGTGSSPLAGVEMLMASNAESGEICLLERVHDPMSSSDLLSPASDCDAVWPGLGGAQRWRQLADGRIDLIEKNGSPVLTLASAEAIGFRGAASGQWMVKLTSLE